ncbi:hypothetical protein [Mycobacterium sp. GA-2829]|uniref:hypothetical protein n=1 Tax=Mycobacterium sp. GA-2829 TaxID=1772283 RepID=UPI00074029A4|nr:hypothetical protein [Mycobacterium sp. GA-2829]KUI27334.1 hypothetical protein AU194_10235 [Mycobacterium sp. GA-2829]
MAVVAVLVFLPGVVYAGRAAMRGHYLTALALTCLVACPVLLVVALQLVRSGRTSLRAEQDSSGTMLLPDKRFSVLTLMGLALAIVGFLVIAVATPLRTLDIPMSDGMRTFSPFVAGFGAVVGVVGLITGWRRGGVGYIELTPSGIDIANIAYTESVDWADIDDVTDTADTKKTRKAVVLRLRDGSEKVIDGADFYVPQGVPLYWMVRHYWGHADDRRELVDGRALERLECARFETL